MWKKVYDKKMRSQWWFVCCKYKEIEILITAAGHPL